MQIQVWCQCKPVAFQITVRPATVYLGPKNPRGLYQRSCSLGLVLVAHHRMFILRCEGWLLAVGSVDG